MSEAMALETSSFGIRTLIVDLGAFRTNVIAAAPVVEPSAPYRVPHVVAAIIESEQKKHGKQMGDPEKAVKVIHDAVSGRDPRLADVLRLPLGADGWMAAVERMEQVRSDFDVCKNAAFSTNMLEQEKGG